MKHRKSGNLSVRSCAALTAAVVAFWGIQPALPVSAQKNVSMEDSLQEEEGTEEIQIRTVQDLRELSERSVYDYYTKDRVFRLMNDIDLAGEKLEPVSVFCGIFEGDGHLIKGFILDEPGSDYGFFRFVEKEGSIRGLTVEGEIRPEGSRKNIGGIAGTNRGSIVNCHFRGSIVAKDTAGGIAGRNEEGGLIVDCTNSAVITATKRSGGIAGYNEGGISGCTNRGRLNATSERVGEGENELSLDLTLDKSKLADEEKVNFTGGIAGISKGLIEDCTNYAGIGYPHVGYHTGGIVGYQNGCVDSCHNYGRIRGRKDVGGIAGLFEPYVEVQYASDTLHELRGQLNALSDSMRELSDTAGHANDRLSDDIDRIGDSTKAWKDTAEEQKDYYLEQKDNFGEEYEAARDKVEDRLDRLEFEADGEEAGKALKTIRTDVQELAEVMARLAAVKEIERQIAGGGLDADAQELLQKMLDELGSGENLEKRLDELQADIEKQADILEDTVSDASDEADELKHNLKRLRSESRDWVRVIRDHAEKVSDDVRDTDEVMSGRTDEVYDEVERLKQELQESNRELSRQINAVERQMDVVQDTLENGLDRADKKRTEDAFDSFEDISDSEDRDNRKGLILDCLNSGEIECDINGGGIAGAVMIEADMESEFQINEVGTRSFNETGTVRASILQCENSSDITVKNDYAGGIAGRGERGAAVGCSNYGNIETANGGYSGGIMGKSGGVIRGCYTLCNVTGSEYSGGIAGLGTDLYDNCAMAGVTSSTGETFGSIAGYLDGEAGGNYFVEEGIPAINGLTYHVQASPMTYEELLEMEDTPDAYRMFYVKFIADDTVIQVIRCKYGESVAENDIPEVPQKEGCYGNWEEQELDHIRRNLTVHAVYDTWVTTIGSDTLSSGNDRPQLLVSANFYPDTRLTCEEISPETYHVGGYRTAAAYDFRLESARQEDYGALRVRVSAPEGRRNMQAAVEQNGTMLLLDTWKDGSYLVFTLEEPGAFIILEESPNYLLYGMAAGTVVIALMLSGILVRSKRNRRKQA